jgi:hypothetical protein
MAQDVVDRILRESGVPDLFAVLAERLSPTDLQSLLLAVYRKRAADQTPARLLEQYEQNRFVRPSPISLQALAEFDRLALILAAPLFDALDLAPVCPLGTNAAVATVDPVVSVATIRNTEVVSDSTNVLALECAVRRRAALRRDARATDRVRLCTSHRLVRAQHHNRPGMQASFRLFALCTAGRDEGSYRFELDTLVEHLGFYLRLLTALPDLGYQVDAPHIALTDWTGGLRDAALRREVVAPLEAAFPGVRVDIDPGRTGGRGYYDGVCFHIYARDATGHELELGDGGFTTWTQQLLTNKKERLLISAIAAERVCSLPRTAG